MGNGKSSRLRYIENFSNYSVPIPWKDYVFILTKHYGFEMDEGAGSAVTFSLGAETFTAYRIHGKTRKERMVQEADRKKAIRALRNLSLIEET